MFTGFYCKPNSCLFSSLVFKPERIVPMSTDICLPFRLLRTLDHVYLFVSVIKSTSVYHCGFNVNWAYLYFNVFCKYSLCMSLIVMYTWCMSIVLTLVCTETMSTASILMLTKLLPIVLSLLQDRACLLFL